MLEQHEIEQFYKIWYSLIWNINEKHKVIPHFRHPVYGKKVEVPIQEFAKVRNKMWENPKWIDEVLVEKDNGEFTEQERAIIKNWRKNFIMDRFIVVKELAKYTVFMRDDTLYAVHGISNPISDNMHYIPSFADVVLIPFNDKIIYDSLICPYNVHFGKGIRTSTNEEYNRIKKEKGITLTLGEEKV